MLFIPQFNDASGNVGLPLKVPTCMRWCDNYIFRNIILFALMTYVVVKAKVNFPMIFGLKRDQEPLILFSFARVGKHTPLSLSLPYSMPLSYGPSYILPITLLYSILIAIRFYIHLAFQCPLSIPAPVEFSQFLYSKVGT